MFNKLLRRSLTTENKSFSSRDPLVSELIFPNCIIDDIATQIKQPAECHKSVDPP